MDDCISRKAAIEALQEHRNLFCDNTPETFSKLSYAEKSRVDELDMAIATLINLPSAQPDSKELSFTQKKLDTISRQAALNALSRGSGCGASCHRAIKALPSALPEPCGDVVSRNAIVQKLNEMDRYVSTELRLCDTDKKFPQNEVFIVDDVYEEIVEQLPSAQPETHEERTETHACDCISRQAAINALMPIYKSASLRNRNVFSTARKCMSAIEELPSAQPERKKGKWIPETEDWRNQIVWVKCSECGFDTSTSYNYCPNCGCRMDGGEQDE